MTFSCDRRNELSMNCRSVALSAESGMLLMSAMVRGFSRCAALGRKALSRVEEKRHRHRSKILFG